MTSKPRAFIAFLLPFALLAAANASAELPTVNYLVTVQSKSLPEAMRFANCYVYNDACTPIAARIGIEPKTRTFSVRIGFDLDWPHLKHEIQKCELAGLEGKISVYDVENEKDLPIFAAEDFRPHVFTEYRAPDWIEKSPDLSPAEIEATKNRLADGMKSLDAVDAMNVLELARQKLGIPRQGYSVLPDMTGIYDDGALGITRPEIRVVTFSWPGLEGDPCSLGLTLRHEFEHVLQNRKADGCHAAGKPSLFDQAGARELFAYLNGSGFMGKWCPKYQRGYEITAAQIIADSRLKQVTYYSVPDKDFKWAKPAKKSGK